MLEKELVLKLLRESEQDRQVRFLWKVGAVSSGLVGAYIFSKTGWSEPVDLIFPATFFGICLYNT